MWRDTKNPNQEKIHDVVDHCFQIWTVSSGSTLPKDALVSATSKIVTAVEADRALDATLAVQRAAFLRDGPPTLKQRRGDLMKLKQAILARQDGFVAALDADFGHRARQRVLMLDLGTTVGAINYLLSNCTASCARKASRGSHFQASLGKGRLPAARCGWHRFTVELSRFTGLDAARHRPCRWQPCDAEAVGDDTRNHGSACLHVR